LGARQWRSYPTAEDKGGYAQFRPISQRRFESAEHSEQCGHRAGNQEKVGNNWALGPSRQNQ
jgi:hypothetical protein